MDIPFEKRFHFADGVSAGNLEELKLKLEKISYSEFYNHVNAEKNDFANWVKHVLDDEHLAADLRSVNSIVETVEIIEDHLHPRQIFVSRQDIQSKIEDKVLKQQIPYDTTESYKVTSSSAPSSSVVAPSTSPELLDLRVIEEKLGLRSPSNLSTSQPSTPKLVAEEKKVREELFGQEDLAKAKLAKSEESTSQQQWPRNTYVDQDMSRLIVKDFIYGLIFGLILGMIIGRIISM